MDDAPPLDAGEAKDETKQPTIGIERTGRDAADALAYFEDARRHEVGEPVAPSCPLELDAGEQLVGCSQGANVNRPRGRRDERGRGSRGRLWHYANVQIGRASCRERV